MNRKKAPATKAQSQLGLASTDIDIMIKWIEQIGERGALEHLTFQLKIDL